MDVHSRTAGVSKRSRTATGGVTTFDAARRCLSHADGGNARACRWGAIGANVDANSCGTAGND